MWYRWFQPYCWNWQHFSHSFGWSEKCKKRRGNCILILPCLLWTRVSEETVFKSFRYRTTPKGKRERQEVLFPLKQLTPAPSGRMTAIVSFSVKFFCCLPQGHLDPQWDCLGDVDTHISYSKLNKLDHDLYEKVLKTKIQHIPFWNLLLLCTWHTEKNKLKKKTKQR